uniref:Gag-Pol polyprotein n=1 Tax=Tanacetum cinerariifolium TaxID=118510 RepID=A0A699K0N9_TANCI|nr:hypothetical protein [Tanacetum cinerariifolium]
MSNNLLTNTKSALHNTIIEAGEIVVPATPCTDDAPPTRESRVNETCEIVSEDIRKKIDAEAEVVHIILTGIQGENINTQDVETNPYQEFRKFTSENDESLESYFSRMAKVYTIIKQSQDLKNVSYHKLFDILKQHQNEVNEIRAGRQARNANPLTLVAATRQPAYKF